MTKRWRFGALALLMFVAVGYGVTSHQRAVPPPEGQDVVDSTAAYQRFQEDIHQLLTDHDRTLESKRAQWQQQREAAWQRHQEEAMIHFEGELICIEEQIAVEAEKLDEAMREAYELPIVNLELQMLIVSLTPDERSERVERLHQLYADYAKARRQAEEDLEQMYDRLVTETKDRANQDLKVAKRQLEAEYQQRYAAVVARLDADLQDQIARYQNALRRALAVRE